MFADLNVNVHDFWDRGLLGLALHPSFPTNPSVYVLYAYDHVLGTPGGAPRWGTAGVSPTPARPRRGRPRTAAWSRAGCRA